MKNPATCTLGFKIEGIENATKALEDLRVAAERARDAIVSIGAVVSDEPEANEPDGRPWE